MCEDNAFSGFSKMFERETHFDSKGVTLMELLLVCALVAIVAALGAPTVYHNYVRESENHMIESLLVEIEYARSMGLTDLGDYATFRAIADSPNFECATQTKRLDGNVKFGESLLIRFDSLGRLIDTSGNPDSQKTLSLKSVDKTIGTVVISPNGLIKRQ